MRRVVGPVLLILALLAAALAGSPPADAQASDVVRIVITADKLPGQDGWLEFTNGSKQWLSPDCRATLEADGVPVAVLPWGQINAMTNAAQRNCESLRPEEDIAPTSSISSPADGAVISGSAAFSGTASDGDGISKVRLRIVDLSTGWTWDGAAFSARSSSVVAELDDRGSTNTGWTYQISSPPAGNMRFKVIVKDRSGQSSSSSWREFGVTRDNAGPTVNVSSPDSVVSGVAIFAGGAIDGDGVDKVRVRIVDEATGRTWDGSSFTTRSSSVTAQLDNRGSSDVDWTYRLGALPVGAYRFKVIANDSAGLSRSTSWRSFDVASGADPAAANLDLILSNPTRNTSFDDNPFRGVPMNQIDVSDLTVNDDIYNEVLLNTSTSGFFRTKCEVSHFAFDDPIVFPNEPGRAHLHMFFGNTEAQAYSTFDSLLNSGTGTCNGADLNRTAYWVPALLDSDGNALIPFEIMVYYKNDNFRLNGANELVVPFPDNLRMISGNGAATTPQTTLSGGVGSLPVISFSCGPAYNSSHLRQALIPDCDGTGNGPYAGRALEMQIAFRQCLETDSGAYAADQSHASYSRYGYYNSTCPDSHPVDISSIMYRIFYSPDDYGGSLNDLHLSSDVKPDQILPGGTTSHADWFGAWHPEAMAQWIENCNNTQADCEIGLLGRTPPVSLVERQRGFYAPGHLVPAEELVELCPGKTFDAEDPLRSVAMCRHGG